MLGPGGFIMVRQAFVQVALPATIVEGNYNIMSCRDLHNNGWDFCYGNKRTLKNGRDTPITHQRPRAPSTRRDAGAPDLNS